nr:RhoGAP [Hymenolepis microstoma]
MLAAFHSYKLQLLGITLIILSSVKKGEVVNWSSYNVYTVASIAKRFLLDVPGGVLGEHNERRLLLSSLTPRETLQSRVSATYEILQQRLPKKLKHAPGFETASYVESGDLEGEETFNSPLLTDKTGLLCDFGMPPITSPEKEQIELFAEILDTLPECCREVVVIFLGILHSMVRYAGFEATKSYQESNPFTLSGIPKSILYAPVSTTSPPPPPIKTLAEAVSKSVAGALFHTCPTSVEMVDRASQVMQTLILRFSHLGETITFHYTDLLLGRVCPRIPEITLTQIQILEYFTVPPPSGARVRKFKYAKYSQKGQEDDKFALPVGRILTMASRLLCLTRSRLGGSQSRKSTTTSEGKPSPTDVTNDSQQPLLQKTIATETKTENASKTSIVGAATQVPVAAIVDEPLADDSQCPGEAHDSTAEENDESVGRDRAHILTRSYIRRSRSRYRAVRRRQMEAMLRRTAWFLGSTTTPPIRLPITPQLLVTPEEVPCAPTSTQSLLEIDMPIDIEEQRKYQDESEIKKFQETLGVPFFLGPLPRVSVTSIRSAPTGQVSPMTSLHMDSEKEEDCEECIEESRSIPRTEL